MGKHTTPDVIWLQWPTRDNSELGDDSDIDLEQITWADLASELTDPKYLRATSLREAAPELLEALKGVLRIADRKTSEFDAARDAIAKATGEHRLIESEKGVSGEQM